MQLRVVTALTAACVAGLISCRDAVPPPPPPPPTQQNDDWAEATLLTLPQPFRYETDGRSMSHFRGRDGTVYSVVAVGDAHGDGPPHKIFAFENGRIRYVVKPTYKRNNAGPVRTSAKITEYDSTGRRIRETESQVSPAKGPALASSTALTPADAPPQSFSDPIGCFSEWFSYSLASAALAAASATLAAAVSACAIDPATCFAVSSASTMWLSALAQWSAALSSLIACQGGGGGSAGGRKVLKYDGTIEDVDPILLTSIDTFFLVQEPL
jgi:hypothetical protein